jgi:hypothetical protein
METDPRGNDRRRILRRREFGVEPACVFCGKTEPIAFHHVAGAANDPDLEGPVCLNCHAVNHEEMRRLGVPLSRTPPRSLLEKIEALLRGLAAFFRLLAESALDFAERLAALIRALDVHLPAWRDLGEAW